MTSTNYKNWLATLDLKTCIDCRSRHGRIYLAQEIVIPKPPLHPRCRCIIEWLKARFAGTATRNMNNGADWWLKKFSKLPAYYINKSEAKNLGYNPILGNLSIVAPGKMLAKGEYKNYNRHLPSASDRVWYEADINYVRGYRGSDRIVYSNDGLIFVTYDHYNTFCEII